MNFASFPYIIFLVICLLAYHISHDRFKHWVLLLFSYVFYSFFGLGFTLLMLFTTIVTFVSSIYCARAVDVKRKRVIFFGGLFVDLTVYILFKYFDFFDARIMNWPNFSGSIYLIPIGISFYTFKTVGYCIDIYKNKYLPERSFGYYALSVSFFPQIIAGPIEKIVNLSQQFQKNAPLSGEKLIDGLRHILWGCFKKIVIADSIARIVDPMFADVYSYSGLDLVLMLVGYTFQVYADFSGYSDIAIGSAKCLGINLPPNFDKPFFSKNYREVWRRWHITFYAWFKEYIYVATLKGSKEDSRWLMIFKVGLLFALVGLWHGASVTYFAYVMTAYSFLVLDILTKDFRKKFYNSYSINTKSFVFKLVLYFLIILMFCCFEIFVKSPTLAYSFYIVQNIDFLHFHKLGILNVLILLFFFVLTEAMQWFQLSADGTCFDRLKTFRARLAMYLFVVFMIILFSGREDVTFQYFQY